MQHLHVPAVAAFLCFIAPPAIPMTVAASVSIPIVTGPIPVTAAPGDPSHEYPFFAASADLADHGYIEEEYFLEGTASRFLIPSPLSDVNTPQGTASVVQTGVPYRTRMLVRRPISPREFNGIVILEWQNVSFGFDVEAVWASSSEFLMRRGYAWIGVSAQRIGINGPRGLRAWSPARYGTLDVTAGGTLLDDSLSYDIFSQAAAAVRRPSGVDPMGGLPANMLIGAGFSQSSAYLIAYQNAVHPLAGIIDGFMPLDGGGFVRADSEAKAFKMVSETMLARVEVTWRQPNTDRFRRWEIAGASHLPVQFQQVVAPVMMRDLEFPLPGNCGQTPFSRIPWHFVLHAMIDGMASWIRDGVEPPIAPDIEVAAVGLPGWFTAEIARDSFGNALGGIRPAEHAVPTATNTGINGPIANACRTFGSYQPFDQATLDALYPDHGTYVSRVAQVTQGNIEAGFILREDGMTTIAAAAHSAIGNQR